MVERNKQVVTMDAGTVVIVLAGGMFFTVCWGIAVRALGELYSKEKE